MQGLLWEGGFLSLKVCLTPRRKVSVHCSWESPPAGPSPPACFVKLQTSLTKLSRKLALVWFILIYYNHMMTNDKWIWMMWGLIFFDMLHFIFEAFALTYSSQLLRKHSWFSECPAWNHAPTVTSYGLLAPSFELSSFITRSSTHKEIIHSKMKISWTDN